MQIKAIRGYEVLDSRGNPTLAAEVILENDQASLAFVPSGASTGKYEASERRDSDPDRYFGKGVSLAVETINKEISQVIRGVDIEDINLIDNLMIEADGTENKEKFGANSILALSMACVKAASKLNKKSIHDFLNALQVDKFSTNYTQSLPVPMMNILNGGAHADNPIDFQEFMVQPKGFESFSESLRCGVEIFQSLKNILQNKGLSTSVGDEGGFAPMLHSPEEALNLILEAIEISGYKAGEDVYICLDIAATEFYSGSEYILEGMGQKYNTSEMIKYIEKLNNNYPISSIEDPLAEDDWSGWVNMTSKMGSKTQLVGDDLFVTNPKRIKKGIEQNAANSVLIKVNQIGTISETIQAVKIAREANYDCVISHRSGETEDTFISDLAVGLGVGQIKAGAPSRSDRVAKYNRLLLIESKSKLSII
tara:strand:- start:8752 stop:10023 length:1272 start_codon:yes stop_codon:yes gene_type:complete